MFRNRTLSIFAAIITTLIALSVGITSAQDTEDSYTLRGLAERTNFHFGAAVYTYHLNEEKHGETLSREFNMLTPENEAKTCELQPSPNTFNFSRLDRLVAFAEEHDMTIRGHTLMWHQCVPAWLENGPFTREEAIEALRYHIYTVVGRYQGRIAAWDVANEGIADGAGGLRETQWRRWIGDDYMELAFQFAHEADPDALLFYNDYGAESMNNKANQIYEMVSDWVARDIPIHGVGMQAHFTVGDVNESQIAENIQRISDLGLQVHITEADVRYAGETTDDILRRQAADYYKLLSACLGNEACTAFVIWGVTDQFTWLRDSNLGFFENPTVEPLLFDTEYEPKPAYFALLDLLARRAGVTSLMTDAQVDEMLGRVEVTVDLPEATKSDPDQLAPDSAAGQAYYAAYPVTITLDGETDDWDNIPRVTVDTGTLIPANHDTALTFAAAADDTHLYLLAEVTDSSLIYGTHDPAAAWYEEDSVEFYINATGDLAAIAYEPGIAQIAILAANITNPDAPIIGGTNSASSEIDVTAIETEDGYLIEASIPLTTSAWTITPEHLAEIGFQAHVNGASTENRDTKLIWSMYDVSDQSWNNPSLFGKLIFWDVSQ